ncbi:hypothetical protein X805_11140 [Sphaerotilus natans subsp. natans DSM 6575]|uniref:Uncharacterized protein n=1 Tax=Sphaerotilus natans subsp. natans DSM 6575 TaxID=1286631 RepID=A0A059KQ96_9BURK|nr:hypothetical protein X805_11140 [Sphaerotilus natans subsp. natans DSM 6575]
MHDRVDSGKRLTGCVDSVGSAGMESVSKSRPIREIRRMA